MSALDWVSALVGPGGVVAGVLGKSVFDRSRSRSEGSKLDADAAKIIAETAVALVAPLKEEIQALNARVDLLEEENTSQLGQLRRSLAYIRDLLLWIKPRVPGEIPPPPPADLAIGA